MDGLRRSTEGQWAGEAPALQSCHGSGGAGILQQAGEVMLLRADLGQLQRPPETCRGGLVPADLLLEFADDGVEKMMRFD